jgi:hypothetical protein
MLNAPAPQDLPVVSTQPARPALVPSENRRADAPPSVAAPAKPAAATRAQADARAHADRAQTERAQTGRVQAEQGAEASKTAARRLTSFKLARVSPWVAAALGAVALLEAGVIAALLIRQPAPAASAAAAAPPASPTPPVDTQPVPDPATLAAGIAPLTEAAPPEPERPDPITQAASNQRSGGVRINAPVELKILQGERVLGSSADGPVIATAGTHTLELINTALGINLRRPVTFRAGQITNENVTIPPGRVSINAQPWAEVFIDSRLVGETPLANLSVPVGEHEVLFRHPELGERRQRITVRADAPSRVSASFER